MRYLTLSWDDGFRRSMLRVAEIFEKCGLRAEMNVLAAPVIPLAGSSAFGDFGLWNELQARGHVIQPHGVDHTNKAQIPLADAQERILRCMDIFSRKLEGFDPRQTIFAFPYNASTPQLEAWPPGVVRAFRTGHAPWINPLPGPGAVKITTSGWEDAETWFENTLEELLALEDAWLVYNVHGLDGEGWGPLRSEFLERKLEQLLSRGDVRILPACEMLDLFQ